MYIWESNNSSNNPVWNTAGTGNKCNNKAVAKLSVQVPRDAGPTWGPPTSKLHLQNRLSPPDTGGQAPPYLRKSPSSELEPTNPWARNPSSPGFSLSSGLQTPPIPPGNLYPGKLRPQETPHKPAPLSVLCCFSPSRGATLLCFSQ